MTNSKEQVVASIVEARAQLDRALEGLEHLPAFNPHDIAFAAHALSNYPTAAGGTVELLLLALQDYPDPEILTWLEGLRQATNLMGHTTSQLMGTSAREGPERLPEHVNLVALVQRCCNYYQHVAERKQIAIT